ncbi:tRNA (N6-isopentenyl adenosine(37)-C2)-methylthiotransferase MiaB [bacterium]|nr:tRNA (N6-isopentenyl adenosine(37)-C2)-methylthiotransferase MiaB [bacterium]
MSQEKKVYIETLGCQMNKSDSERMLGMLSHFGYIETSEPKTADLLIINTCSIRQLSEDKAYSYVGVWSKWKETRPELKIAVSGCVAQQYRDKLLKRFQKVDLVMGPRSFYRLPSLLEKINNGERICDVEDAVNEKENNYPIKRISGYNAWIPISEGCNNFCTYCIVPYVRGRERSRSLEVIKKEVVDALKQGYKEITLLGQNVDSWGKDFDDETLRLGKLLRELNTLDYDFRIRFVTSYPTDITDDVIKAVQECDKVCEYFHIPMQSGNSEVLKAMNRRYTREQYGEIVKKIRNTFENVTITSDFIAGFPGETEEQFNDTLSAIDEFELDYSNTAAYSPREGTVAAKWVDKFLDEKTKKERLARLNEKNRQACLKSNQKALGKIYEVLVEDFEEKDEKIILKSKSRNNKYVHFEGEKELIGKFVNVKINKASTWHLAGEILS